MPIETKSKLSEIDFIDSRGNHIKEGFYTDPENKSIAVYLNPSFSRIYNEWLGCDMHHKNIEYSIEDTRRLIPFSEEEIAKMSGDYIEKKMYLHRPGQEDTSLQYSEVFRINNIIQKRKTDPDYKKGLCAHMNLP